MSGALFPFWTNSLLPLRERKYRGKLPALAEGGGILPLPSLFFCSDGAARALAQFYLGKLLEQEGKKAEAIKAPEVTPALA